MAVLDNFGGLVLDQIGPGQLKGVGAICSELAAEHFGLEVLEKGLESLACGFTKSWTVSIPKSGMTPQGQAFFEVG